MLGLVDIGEAVEVERRGASHLRTNDRDSFAAARDSWRARRKTRGVFVVRGTKRFLDRVGGATGREGQVPTTSLGDWYAKVLFWKPQVALFVEESTLLPVLMPFAPGVTIVDRFPQALLAVLEAHVIDREFVQRELAEMSEFWLAPTASRRVLGVMNEFAHLADLHHSAGAEDLLSLSVCLSETPCSPLYGRHVSPDRELAAHAACHGG